MREIILDGREMVNKRDVHDYLKKKLELTSFYGNNLDALWDVLRSSDERIRIILIYKEELVNSLGRYGEALVLVFEDAAKVNPNIVYQEQRGN